MSSKHKDLAKNTVIMLIGKIFTQFLSFFLLPLYTHTLPAEDYGSVDLVMSYIGLLVPVITIQQEMAVFRYLVDVRRDRMKRAQVVATALKSLVLRLSCFLIPAVLASFFINWQYFYIVLFAGSMVAISNLLLQIARGFGENVKYTIGSSIAGVVTITSNLILICLLHMGAGSILISSALANLCCSLYLFMSLGIARHLKIAKPEKKLRNRMLKYSWPLVPNGVSWWMINASDRTIVSIFLGTAMNGIYAVANKFPSILSSFLGIFTLSWTESASVHINDDDRDEFFSSVARNTVRMFSSLGVLVIAAMPLVFDIIIGPNYREAYNYIPIAMLGVLFNCMVSTYSAIYVAKKMTKQVATTSLFCAIINIVVDLVLIHFIGLYAAMVSTAVAYLTMTIYRHFDLKKYVRIKYRILDLVMAVMGLVVISAIYYSGNALLYFIGAALAIVYAVMMNWNIIKKVLRKIRK